MWYIAVCNTEFVQWENLSAKVISAKIYIITKFSSTVESERVIFFYPFDNDHAQYIIPKQKLPASVRLNLSAGIVWTSVTGNNIITILLLVI